MDLHGKKIYPDAKKLLICADSDGSNGYGVRLWEIKLQEFANKSGREIGITQFQKIELSTPCHLTLKL